MRRILNNDLSLAEKLQKEGLDSKNSEKLKLLEKRILKFSDKLHASKTEMKADISGEMITKNPELESLAKMLIEKWKLEQKTSSESQKD
jgi:hypothetical protein